MRQTTLHLFIMTLLAVSAATSAFGQITVEPIGISAAIDNEEERENTLTVTNTSNEAVVFEIKLKSPDREERRGGPARDDLGDPIGEFRQPVAAGSYKNGCWDPDNEWFWIQEYSPTPQTWALDPADDFSEAAHFNTRNTHMDQAWHDGILYVMQLWNPLLMRYDVDGRQLDQINLQNHNGINGVAVSHEQEVILAVTGPGNPHNLNVFNLEGERIAEVGNIDPFVGNGLFRSIEYVDLHRDGELWVNCNNRAWQIDIDPDNWEFVGDEAVANFQSESGNEYAVIAHDGFNLWISQHNGVNVIGYDDGVVEPYWLMIEPMEGEIPAGESMEINALITSAEQEPGDYDLYLHFIVDGQDEPAVSLSAVMTLESQAASIFGAVTDARTHQPVEGVTAALDYYIFERQTDAEGNYAMEELPLRTYEVTFTAPDYLPLIREVELDEGGIELNVELLHSECDLSIDEVNEQLAPNTDTHIEFNMANNGNGPLTWTVDRRLLGDANAEPWEMRREYRVAQLLEDDRIEGVAFDGEYFYYAGAHGDDPNVIYVVDINGEYVRQFVQPGESNYGMKDLEWDGELLWGGADSRGFVFGFDTDGEVHFQFEGPFNPTTNVVWDSDREVLWLSNATSNLVGYTRDGQATGRILNRKGLRIYGTAYWPEDPDGYTLYLLNSPQAGQMVVHKMDPVTGDTLRARNLVPMQGAAAGGAFICNTFDVYSWVMMFTNNVGLNLGGDRSFIYQLDARKEWFIVEPTAGVIEAGAAQQFDLHLNAASLPAVLFEGELFFSHDGVGGSTTLPVRLDVIGGGPVHARREIELVAGWNLMSSNVTPDVDDIVALTNPLVEAGELILVKDDLGHFYHVGRGFSNLSPWAVSEGYLFKVNRQTSLTVEGNTVAADEPIDLTRGWQSIAYYPRRPVNAIVALSGIRDQLLLAKDGFGNFYLPARNYSNMGDMIEGRGYQIRVSEDAQLIYQANERVRAAPSGHFASGLHPSGTIRRSHAYGP